MKTSAVYNGKAYSFSDRLEWGRIKELFAWIKEQEGDVFADLERFIDRIPEAERAVLFRERQERRDQIKSLNLASPIAREYLQTPEGAAYMALAMLQPNHPEVTLDLAMAIIQAIDPEEMTLLRKRAEEANRGRAKNASAPA